MTEIPESSSKVDLHSSKRYTEEQLPTLFHEAFNVPVPAPQVHHCWPHKASTWSAFNCSGVSSRLEDIVAPTNIWLVLENLRCFQVWLKQHQAHLALTFTIKKKSKEKWWTTSHHKISPEFNTDLLYATSSSNGFLPFILTRISICISAKNPWIIVPSDITHALIWRLNVCVRKWTYFAKG